MKNDRLFTVVGWYHLGFFHPLIKRVVMIGLTLLIVSLLVFYIVPFKYAIGVLAIWLVFFAVFLLLRYVRD